MTAKMDRRALLASVTSLSLLPLVSPAWAQPALPAGAPPRPTPAQWARTPNVEQIALSPDAGRIAYVTVRDKHRVLMLLDMKTQKVEQVPLGDYKLRDMFWASPRHVVFETSLTTPIQVQWKADEYYQAHVFNTETGKVFTLFDKMNDYYNFSFGNYSIIIRNGVYSLIAVNFLRSTEEMTMFEFNLDKNTPKIVDGGREGTIGWAVHRDGRLAGRSNIDYDSVQKRFWFLEVFVDGKWKEIYRKEVITEVPRLGLFGPDGKTLVVYLNEEGNGGTYHEIDVDGKIGPALFEGIGNRIPIYHPMTKFLCGYAEEGDWPVYHYDDKVLAGVLAAAKDMLEPGERVRVADRAEDPRKLVLYTEGAGNAGGYFYADFSTGDVIPILRNYPDIPPEWIIDKKPITYKAADGFEVPAYLTLPPFREAKDLPLVVLVHGGPQSRDTLALDWEAQVYAAQGYAVLQPNYRGSSGYGWDFMAAGFGEYGRKMQTDLSDGVRHLARQGLIDPKRVAIAGASYGGYAALAGATLDRGNYRCAIAVAAVSDPEEHYNLKSNLRENSSYRSRKRMLGDGSMAEISPLRNADKADCPILLIHGEHDTVVSIEESNRMAAALKRAGKPFEYVKLKKEDHWQSTEAGRTIMIETIIPFLQKHNPS
jgi:dipeptidyl aminopeptidase/acylaminoacyl peptidase